MGKQPYGQHALSPLQSGMLFHHLAEPGSGVDVEQLVCQVPDPLDPKILGAALGSLLKTHPILKMRFQWGDGGQQAFQEMVEELSLIHI